MSKPSARFLNGKMPAELSLSTAQNPRSEIYDLELTFTD
jgi:hypothetical protein